MRGNELLRSLCHTVPSSARARVPQSILTSMLHLHCIYSGQFSSYRNWKLFLLYQNGVEFLNPFGYNKGGKLDKAVIVGAILRFNHNLTSNNVKIEEGQRCPLHAALHRAAVGRV